MRVAVFSTKRYDRESPSAANESRGHELTFLEPRLTPETAPLARGFPAVCAFVNDQLSAPVLAALAEGGTRRVALRSAGFDNVDLRAAGELGMVVTRVPAYSPHAVAEHAVGLILALARKIHRAYDRVREGNFALDGLLGSDLHGRTVGIVGTGKIGEAFARTMAGFGCRLLAADPPAGNDGALRGAPSTGSAGGGSSVGAHPKGLARALARRLSEGRITLASNIRSPAEPPPTSCRASQDNERHRPANSLCGPVSFEKSREG